MVTGQDTPQNLELLFGPNWRKDISTEHDTERVHVLLNPPPGSRSHAMTAEFDKGAPTWSPRPANSAEQEQLDDVRDMQETVIKKYDGPPPSTATMKEVFGIWESLRPGIVKRNLPVYQLAVDCMDTGVSTTQ